MPPLVEVRGRFVRPDGRPARGRVHFRLTAPLIDASGRVIATRAVQQVELNEEGRIVVELVPTNAPGYTPEGVTYEVTEWLPTNNQSRSYYVQVPHDAPEGRIDLAELVPADTPELHTYALVQGVSQAEFAADKALNDAHRPATEDVHGIPDTQQLATLTDLQELEIEGYTRFGLLQDVSVEGAAEGQSPIFADGTWVPADRESPAGAQAKADAAQSAAQEHADSAVANHNTETADVHGISDTSALETQIGAQDRVDAHDVATGVHGVGASTVASVDDVNAAQSAAQDHADTAVSDHNAETSVHGVDTTQLATQDDLANLEPLPEPTEDGDVLTLADGSPTWAAPEAGGLDPDGPETITGDWLFDRERVRAGTDVNGRLSLGIFAATGGNQSTNVGIRAGGSNIQGQSTFGWQSGRINVGEGLTAIGMAAGMQNTGAYGTTVGRNAGRDQSGNHVIAIGRAAARNNSRDNRLIIDTANSDNGNLVDPLIDGRFRAGTDGDSFTYSKGVKINGYVEPTEGIIMTTPNGTRVLLTIDDEFRVTVALTDAAITPGPDES